MRFFKCSICWWLCDFFLQSNSCVRAISGLPWRLNLLFELLWFLKVHSAGFHRGKAFLLVNSEDVLAVVPSLAIFTLKWLEVVMAPFVIHHVALGAESFAAFTADKRSLIFVNALVDS